MADLEPQAADQEPQEEFVEGDQEPHDEDLAHEAYGDQGYRFSLSPAHAVLVVLDYREPSAQKIYRAGVEKIEPAFDCTAPNLKGFLSQVGVRALIMSWYDVIQVYTLDNMDNYEQQLDRPSLLTDYGTISMAQVRRHAERYIGENCRAAQNSHMLYVCLHNSLTKEARDKMILNAAEYTVNGQFSGALFLRVLIRDSHLDTNATSHIIRERLSSLDRHMMVVGSDIKQFNNHVKELIDSLHARGATTQDLLANLFKAYRCVSDKNFVTYMNNKQAWFDEGNDIEPTVLMQWALDKYNRGIETGEWNAPSTEEIKIIALEAKVKSINAARTRSTAQLPKATSKSQLPRGKEGSKKRTTSGRTTGGQGKARLVPEWMKKPPTPGEPHTKKRDDKSYNWCTHHLAWTRHTTAECQLNDPANKQIVPYQASKQGRGEANGAQTLQLSRALAAVVENYEQEA